MLPLPPSCPELPELPPLFWNEVNDRIGYWQGVFAEPNPPPIEAMRKACIARIKTRLKNIYARKKNAGRSLFELAQFVACLIAIESRN
jgi:hypothetical protein